MHRKVVSVHCGGERHKSEYRKLESAAEQHKVRMACLERRISLFMAKELRYNQMMVSVRQLPVLKWRDDVEVLLIGYKSNNNILSGISDDYLYKQAQNALQRYQKMETLSLLELALWKVQCLSQDNAKFRTMQEIDDYWAVDESFDPVAYRRDIRMSSSSGIAVIVPLVSKFL